MMMENSPTPAGSEDELVEEIARLVSPFPWDDKYNLSPTERAAIKNAIITRAQEILALPRIRTALDAEKERVQLLEQLATRTPSVVERTMQLVMQHNNDLGSKLSAAESRVKELEADLKWSAHDNAFMDEYLACYRRSCAQAMLKEGKKTAAAEGRVAKLEAALEAIEQRANESGTGDGGLLETIHAMNEIARRATTRGQG